MVKSVPQTITVEAAELPLRDLVVDFDRVLKYLKQTRQTVTSIVVRDALPSDGRDTLSHGECRLFMSPLDSEPGMLYIEYLPKDFEWAHDQVKKLGLVPSGFENRFVGEGDGR